MVSLESDARLVFELEKEWGSMPPDKKIDGEHEVPEFVLHVHVVDTELSTDLKCYYDENHIFSIEAILRHKQVACMRRKMLFTIFKYLFLFQRYSSF